MIQQDVEFHINSTLSVPGAGIGQAGSGGTAAKRSHSEQTSDPDRSGGGDGDELKRPKLELQSEAEPTFCSGRELQIGSGR
jgi:hypothetical protein